MFLLVTSIWYHWLLFYLYSNSIYTKNIGSYLHFCISINVQLLQLLSKKPCIQCVDYKCFEVLNVEATINWWSIYMSLFENQTLPILQQHTTIFVNWHIVILVQSSQSICVWRGRKSKLVEIVLCLNQYFF